MSTASEATIQALEYVVKTLPDRDESGAAPFAVGATERRLSPQSRRRVSGLADFGAERRPDAAE